MTSMHLLPTTIAVPLLLHREGTENYLLFGLSQQNHMLVRGRGGNIGMYLQFIHKYSIPDPWNEAFLSYQRHKKVKKLKQ